VSHLNDEGSTMPGFTFERISPPPQREPSVPTESEKPRGVVGRMLERFVEMRVRLRLSTGAGVSERRKPRDDI
jgi:hypothetical protein